LSDPQDETPLRGLEEAAVAGTWRSNCSVAFAMAYPLRHFDPHTIYFITSRTIQSRFLMAPSDKANELIGGILARGVRQCEVELFAYVFTSNHFHAMVRAPSAIAMSRFMQRLQGNIAVKVGRLVGWRGRFFA